MNKLGLGAYLFLCSLLVCDIAVHCVRAQSTPATAQSVVRTHSLEIVDHVGKVTATISNDSHGNVEMVMFDPKGRKRFMVGAANQSTALGIYNSHGQDDIMIGGGDAPKESPDIVVYKNDLPSASMFSDINGRSGFGVFDDHLVVRAAIDYQYSGTAQMAVFDNDKHERAGMEYYAPIDTSVIATEDGTKGAELTCDPDDSSVSASDKSMRRAQLIYTPQFGKAKVVVDDKAGNPIWQAPGRHQTNR